ncbi:hypothetical protein GCM10008179_31900 [Hansschlegelia plantiphila]|uniref:Uncharacterized protein n=1 Tax=Hansschlegelia plantiphila TaxID=374655 RepID=A0A9W6MX67_9HYPH|nr:hypothetical protein GCM10008179_31900 [Hansschlegelia plantiphila]
MHMRGRRGAMPPPDHGRRGGFVGSDGARIRHNFAVFQDRKATLLIRLPQDVPILRQRLDLAGETVGEAGVQ